MENLNKENFWNALQELYPNAMKEFCDWIDHYKIKVRWIFLFSGTDIKFHDIPFDMQMGILGRFLCEKNGCSDPDHKHMIDMVRGDLTKFFMEREKTLSNG